MARNKKQSQKVEKHKAFLVRINCNYQNECITQDKLSVSNAPNFSLREKPQKNDKELSVNLDGLGKDLELNLKFYKI